MRILKKVFKYDHSNKKRNLCLTFLCFSILVFIYLSVILLDIRSLCNIPSIILFALSAMHYSKKGIIIDYDKKQVIVRDGGGKNVFPIDKIKRVSISEINKVNKGEKNSLCLFAMGKEEIDMWRYVYNNGKVYYIVFQIEEDDGYSIYKSYFGWMYREKNEEKVKKKQAELTAFVDHINKLCKEQRQRKSR